jgi:hypothetical protein
MLGNQIVDHPAGGLMPDGAGSYCKEFFLLTYQKLIFLSGQENKCCGGVRQKLERVASLLIQDSQVEDFVIP